MIKIIRVVGSEGIRLVVSGRIGAEHLRDFTDFIAAESQGMVLDLTEVTLVDVEVVRFLVQCELQGLRIGPCPAYIREWMDRERGPF